MSDTTSTYFKIEQLKADNWLPYKRRLEALLTDRDLLGGEKGRRGDRFRMGYDRARECRRSTEVNGRGFRNTDMDHYTTARFKGMKEEGKGDGRGLPEVKAGKPEEKCRRPEEVRSRMYKSGRPGKVFDKSGRRTEDGSQVRRPEGSDVGGSVKTTENDGKPNNVNNQSK
ncbi:hypothetical protein K438DRAFT_1780048 [Mycena galopus ATCC 62051]|nr:hypothetical protein K438DRAFT_1780048 [Mycena galopus ATCC 62051]